MSPEKQSLQEEHMRSKQNKMTGSSRWEQKKKEESAYVRRIYINGTSVSSARGERRKEGKGGGRRREEGGEGAGESTNFENNAAQKA